MAIRDLENKFSANFSIKLNNVEDLAIDYFIGKFHCNCTDHQFVTVHPTEKIKCVLINVCLHVCVCVCVCVFLFRKFCEFIITRTKHCVKCVKVSVMLRRLVKEDTFSIHIFAQSGI